MKPIVRSEVFVTVTSNRSSAPALSGPEGGAMFNEKSCLSADTRSVAQEANTTPMKKNPMLRAIKEIELITTLPQLEYTQILGDGPVTAEVWVLVSMFPVCRLPRRYALCPS